MSDFRVFETDQFSKSLKKLPSQDAAFLRQKIDSFVYPQIKAEPFWGNNVKKLRGYRPETWRYRIGKFRLFYLVDPDEKIIFMLTVDYRKDSYR